MNTVVTDTRGNKHLLFLHSHKYLKYQLVTKTKPIVAISFWDALRTGEIPPNRLIDTFEGLVEAGEDMWLCRGLTMREPWIQSHEDLFHKYEIGGMFVDGDRQLHGYHVFYPKPDNMEYATKIWFLPKRWNTFAIESCNGEKIGGRRLFFGNVGDYILCRMNEEGRPDFTDSWVVAQKYFDATYEWVKE